MRVLALLICALAAGPMTAGEPSTFLDDPFEIGECSSYHAALLHWVDSLSGVTAPAGTAGKTMRAHRAAYERMSERLGGDEIDLLRGFRQARADDANAAEAHERNRLTVSFFGAKDLDTALGGMEAIAGDGESSAIRAALGAFDPHYRTIWNEGEQVRLFLERSAEEPARDEIAAFLVKVARFYAPEESDTRPCLVFAPVDPGFGTHAQAIDRFLLIEVRPGDSVREQVGPIVHEAAHFLFDGIDPERKAALEETAASIGAAGVLAWSSLAEALPTALAQGVATKTITPDRWSEERRWYHRGAVDAYAKRLLPLVEQTLEAGGSFDDDFMRKAVELWPTD